MFELTKRHRIDAAMNAISKIQAYLWATPNCRRVSILLEELGLEYLVHPINIRAGEQFASAVLRLNRYGKLPILTWREDGEEHVMSESGAILLRFAQTRPDLLPFRGKCRDRVMVWYMFTMTSLGPMTGNAHHWTMLASKRPRIASDHHVKMVKRAYAVVEENLAENEYLAGQYSLADIAAYPWIAVYDWAAIDLADFPAIAAWLERMANRAAVQRGMQVPLGAQLI